MRVIDLGHEYELDILDSVVHPSFRQVLTFVKREGVGYPGNVGHHPGTNLQETWRAGIDRLKFLDKQESSIHNAKATMAVRMAIRELEIRAAERHGREWFDPACPIELAITCRSCGHVGCEGECKSRKETHGG